MCEQSIFQSEGFNVRSSGLMHLEQQQKKPPQIIINWLTFKCLDYLLIKGSFSVFLQI